MGISHSVFSTSFNEGGGGGGAVEPDIFHDTLLFVVKKTYIVGKSVSITILALVKKLFHIFSAGKKKVYKNYKHTTVPFF